MTFALQIPTATGNTLNLDIELGQTLFVLGANGTGKSALLQRLFANHQGAGAKRIAAHRTNYFQNDNSTFSFHERKAHEAPMGTQDAQPSSRFRDGFAHVRPNLAIYGMVEAQEACNRKIADAAYQKQQAQVDELTSAERPVAVLNRILRTANFPISVFVGGDGQLFAQRDGGSPYSITQLSDGERNALLLMCDFVAARPGTLLLVDEPERHLHQSIISPLLRQLLSERDDLAVVICTHDIALPITATHARTLLVRSCIFQGEHAVSWECELAPQAKELPEDVVADILGGRQKLLFVEGVEKKLDKPLYALLFPMISVVAKSSCADVERAVRGVCEVSGQHRLQAWGLVDGDGQSQGEVEKLAGSSVFCVPYYHVEALYYHPNIQAMAVKRLCEVTGNDPSEKLSAARVALLENFERNVDYLASFGVARSIRTEITNQIPGRKKIVEGQIVAISIDVSARLSAAKAQLEKLTVAQDVEALLRGYPIRETGALGAVAKCLGFAGTDSYQKAVLKLLIDDPSALQVMRDLLGPAVSAVS
jgi:ABC-type hemin transport system ATPase subunit